LKVVLVGAASGPVVILNNGLSRTDILIVTSSGVVHIPILSLTYMKIDILVKWIQAAIACEGGRRSFLPEANCAEMEGLAQQLPASSHALQFLRLLHEARYVGRASDAQMHPNDIFRFVLGVFWVSIAMPVIRALKLEVSWIHLCKSFPLEFNYFPRNLKHHHFCDGAPLGYSHSCQYTQPVSMVLMGLKVFRIMLFRPMCQPSVHFLPPHLSL
jgi:hypothetical protein